GEEAVAPGEDEPILVPDAPGVQRGAGAAPGVVVLQAAVDIVWLLKIVSDLVDLGRVDALNGIPRFAAVPGDVDPPVVALNQVKRVGRVDPEGMVVGVR